VGTSKLRQRSTPPPRRAAYAPHRNALGGLQHLARDLTIDFSVNELEARPLVINRADLGIDQTRLQADLAHDDVAKVRLEARRFLRPRNPQTARFREMLFQAGNALLSSDFERAKP